MSENVKNICEECGCTGEELFELEGRMVCADCAEDMGYVRCVDCGEWELESNAHELPCGDYICDGCYENGYFTCEDCGEIHPVDEGTWVNRGTGREALVCEDCLDDNYYRCADCGDYFSLRYIASHDVDGVAVCDDCWDRGYWHICEDCGRIIHDDDASWDDDDDCYHCYSCYRRRQSQEAEHIHDYGYKPSPEFKFRASEGGNEFRNRTETLAFGVELEVDQGDDRCELTRKLNELEQPIYMKRDGSLDKGVEIVTHPCSLAYHQYELRWAEITRQCKKAGFRSHDTNTCGLHIHVGKEPMGRTFNDQQRAVGNLVILTNTLWKQLATFSRRKEDKLDYWASKPNMNLANGTHYTDSELTAKAVATEADGRYQAVNLCNYATVEFRLFRGTLKRDTILASIQLVHNMTRYAMTHTPTECLTTEFADIVNVEQFEELNAYCKERGLI